jgi:hypothetical protein
MFNKNIECRSLEQRKTLSLANSHSIGKKTMFKKFAILFAPFILAPLSSLLTNSAAHSQTTSTYWTNWTSCEFSSLTTRDYTNWRAQIEVRSTDRAARPIRIQYGDGNTERISSITAWDSRDINGTTANYFENQLIWNTNNYTSGTSPYFYPTWISTLYPRYANVQMKNADNRVCKSRIRMQ